MKYLSQREKLDNELLIPYENLKKRFNEKGIPATLQTLERSRVIISAFLKKGRPLKPAELAEMVMDDPAFSDCRTRKSMVLYTLRKMAKAGIVKKGEYRGRKCYYHIAIPLEELLKPEDKPASEPLENAWIADLHDGLRRIQELLLLMKLWRIPSLTHTIALESSLLRDKVKRVMDNSSQEKKKRLKVLEDHIAKLGELFEGNDEGLGHEEDANRLLGEIRKMIRELIIEDEESSLSLNNRRSLTEDKPKSGRRAGGSLEASELSAVFLQLYDQVKRGLRERGMRGDVQTMEKFQAMLLVFLEKGRPLRPYELVDALLYNPAFRSCKDARRMVFYVLDRLVKTGVVEKTVHRGKFYYRLAEEIKCAKVTAAKPKNPVAQEILNIWRRVFELRSIAKLWRISSLAHALVYELHVLQEKLSKLGMPEELENDINKLIEAYSSFATTGKIPTKEAEHFSNLGRAMNSLIRAS